MVFPVKLLRDQRGIYGFGLTSERRHRWKPRNAVVLRPDMLEQHPSSRGAVLQKITGGFRRGLFQYATEEGLRQIIHHEMLNRRGLSWPPEDVDGVRWWSRDPQQQKRNRQIYHGLRLASLGVINRLIGQTLAEAADQDAVTLARRFVLNWREDVYRVAARSRRAMQLFATFPALAFRVYLYPDGLDGVVSSKPSERQERAKAQVERGARLRDVAVTMDTAMALRAVKPGAAHLGNGFVRPELIPKWLPNTTAQQRIWLQAIQHVHRESPDFMEWVARRVTEMPGKLFEVLTLIEDLSDWARACRPQQRCDFDVNWQFITRRFVSSMSLKTVIELSREWHEAVAQKMDGPNCALPQPWYPAAKLHNGYEILPLTTAADLYLEGRTMHHCVGTYVEPVKRGGVYVYSIREHGQRHRRTDPPERGRPARARTVARTMQCACA
jgi:hypothetical protein